MTWHELPELPKPDTEVLAEVELYNGSIHFMVVIYEERTEEWKRALSIRYDFSVKRWAYIEEE